MSWRTVVAKSAVKRLIPFKPTLRRMKRTFYPAIPNRGNMSTTLTHAKHMFDQLDHAGIRIEGARVMEIGSGWFPVIPILLRLKGAASVMLTDVDTFLDEASFQAARSYIGDALPDICGRFGLDSAAAASQLDGFTSIAAAGFTYNCPFDPDLIRNAQVDLVTSRTVLEHIPPGDLVTLFRALRRKLSTGGVMIHLVDQSDHLEHVSKDISRIHFLTLTPTAWRFVNAACDYQNRLRHSQFLPLFEKAGFDVIGQTQLVDDATLERVPSLKLVAPFDTMPPDELATIESIFLLKPQML